MSFICGCFDWFPEGSAQEVGIWLLFALFLVSLPSWLSLFSGKLGASKKMKPRCSSQEKGEWKRSIKSNILWRCPSGWSAQWACMEHWVQILSTHIKSHSSPLTPRAVGRWHKSVSRAHWPVTPAGSTSFRISRRPCLKIKLANRTINSK